MTYPKLRSRVLRFVFPIVAPIAKACLSRHPSPFSFSSRDAKPFCNSEGMQARVNAPFSTSVAIRSVPASGPLHRCRRYATRTNEGTLKGTHLRLFFATEGSPARCAGTPRHAALASKKQGHARREFQRQPETKKPRRRLLSALFPRRFSTLARDQPAASAGAIASATRATDDMPFPRDLFRCNAEFVGKRAMWLGSLGRERPINRCRVFGFVDLTVAKPISVWVPAWMESAIAPSGGSGRGRGISRRAIAKRYHDVRLQLLRKGIARGPE